MLDSFELEGIYESMWYNRRDDNHKTWGTRKSWPGSVSCNLVQLPKFFRSSDNCVALSERFSASLQKQLSIGERKNFEKRKPVAGTDPVSALLIAPQWYAPHLGVISHYSHHTLKLQINKTHYEAVHAPCLWAIRHTVPVQAGSHRTFWWS